MSTTHGAALVSGASRGLGAIIARRLAADGWPVAVNYRSALERDEASHVVEDILARGGTAEALDPGRAARGLPGRWPAQLSRGGTTRPDGRAGGHRSGRVVPRVRLSIIHHRRAADRVARRRSLWLTSSSSSSLLNDA
jgi:NAD(P)-dependent dehydrogenase (short-subunit alcohol dehydrogenase family)